MNTTDAHDPLQALNRQGKLCKDKVLRQLGEWPVAELSMRIPLADRPWEDRQLIHSTLRETLHWMKLVGTYRTLHDLHLVYNCMRELTSATIDAEYRDPAVIDASKALDEVMALLSPISNRFADVYIIMAMDAGNRELEDIHVTIKDACNECGLRAIRADEVPHSELIAKVIKDLITSAQIVIADLSWDRPNVYQEVGIAQGRDKELILVRKQGVKLHTNLAGNNVQEYGNCIELKRLIIERLQFLPRAA